MNGYLSKYAKYMDDMVKEDPYSAVGGKWRKLGKMQYLFLTSRGLVPYYSVLDIGCGTLRGGLHFIKRLDPWRYVGIDISSEAILHGKKLVEDFKLSYKFPKLIVNKDLKFRKFYGTKFDYILAHSVFTHLPSDCILECLENIGKIMHRESLFYFTFFYADEEKQAEAYKFRYPTTFFERLGEEHGFRVVDVSSEYSHPRGQKMLEVKKRGKYSRK